MRLGGSLLLVYDPGMRLTLVFKGQHILTLQPLAYIKEFCVSYENFLPVYDT